jgi:hypothetical protein
MSELTKALAKAQGAFPPIPKNREVNAGPRKYKYAELATILATVTPVLAANGLAITQRTDVTDRGTMLITDLRHIGGEVLSSTLPLHMDNLQPQALGSLLTYLKRYSLTSLLNVAADEDDDAHVAQEQPRQTQQPRQQPPPRKLDVVGKAPQEAVEAALAVQESDPWKVNGVPVEQLVPLLETAISTRPWLEVSKMVPSYVKRLNLTEAETELVRKAFAERKDAEKQTNLLAAG